MKDLHSHLLYGTDNGSNTLEESITLIKKASEQGISELMITPHYIHNSQYISDNEEKIKLFKELKKAVKQENIDIKLYLGNEVYFTDNILDLLNSNEITTLNNSRYVLIEFPENHILRGSKHIIYNLVQNGYVPVLAHPETNKFFQKHPRAIEEYLREGVLLQCNYKSLYGNHGRDAKKTMKLFLKSNIVSFLGSDCHHEENFKLKRLEKDLKRITKNKDRVKDMLYNNFDKVINNQEIGIILGNHI